MKKTFYITLLLGIVLFTSCKVDFSPNAQWKDVPVVYCLLDQDEDTTFVRVQRCFLGEDNLYHYTAIADSVNYPQGTIEVKMLQWKGTILQREYVFDYMVGPVRDSGQFSSVPQPIYACRTKGLLDESADYELLVLKDGDTLARATTPLISGEFKLHNPNSGFSHEFKFRNGSCAIQWSALKNGRLYQPVVRFYYKEYGDTMFVDIPCATKLDQHYNSDRLDINLPVGTFMADLKSKLENDTTKKNFVDFVDITIMVCAEDLNAYMHSQNPGTSVSQENQVYTNIKGGIGVFSSRRLHLRTNVPCDSTTGTASNKSLRDYVRELNVGFE